MANVIERRPRFNLTRYDDECGLDVTVSRVTAPGQSHCVSVRILVSLRAHDDVDVEDIELTLSHAIDRAKVRCSQAAIPTPPSSGGPGDWLCLLLEWRTACCLMAKIGRMSNRRSRVSSRQCPLPGLAEASAEEPRGLLTTRRALNRGGRPAHHMRGKSRRPAERYESSRFRVRCFERLDKSEVHRPNFRGT